MIDIYYTYDSWGKLISKGGSLASTVGEKNPYRYRGYRYDAETGLYYLQSRYYNPEWGRFVNGDDTGILQLSKGELLEVNLFAYANNNPVMNSDKMGRGVLYDLINLIVTYIGYTAGWWLIPIGVAMGGYSYYCSERNYKNATNSIYYKLRCGRISLAQYRSYLNYNNCVRKIGWVIAALIGVTAAMGFLSIQKFVRCIRPAAQIITYLLTGPCCVLGGISLSASIAQVFKGYALYKY